MNYYIYTHERKLKIKERYKDEIKARGKREECLVRA